jgi:hypothetical protein
METGAFYILERFQSTLCYHRANLAKSNMYALCPNRYGLEKNEESHKKDQLSFSNCSLGWLGWNRRYLFEHFPCFLYHHHYAIQRMRVLLLFHFFRREPTFGPFLKSVSKPIPLHPYSTVLSFHPSIRILFFCRAKKDANYVYICPFVS